MIRSRNNNIQGETRAVTNRGLAKRRPILVEIETCVLSRMLSDDIWKVKVGSFVSG